MDRSRSYILDRIRSKKTSIEEFNYDKLEAPPLSWFFSPFDIQELNSIARSIRYSAKPQARYEAINKVCNRCGLVKFAAGTNRVVYRHPEFQDILFKIAADDVGLNDNPAEYRNQFLLKPFVAKTFEISPCGTVAIVERVNPITSREEYISVADDVFELITEWLVGKYVLADIGTKFFMNIGIRANFGVVLLDYPYVYELDGNKIFCRKPDPTSPTGVCDGEIDYDDGFNFLRCTKCGAVYKAKELEKKIKDNEIIVEREGEIKMKITAKGGSKNINMTVETEGIGNDNFMKVRANIPLPTEIPQTTAPAPERNARVIFGANNKDDNAPKPVIKKIEEFDVPVDSDPVKKEEKKEPVINTVEKTVNGVPSKIDVAQSPVSFSDKAKQEAIENKKEEKPLSPVEAIDNAVNTILENLELIDLDVVKNDTIVRVFDALAGVLPVSPESFGKIIRLANDIIIELEDEEYIEAANNENLIDFISKLFSGAVKFTSYDRDGEDLVVSFESGIIHVYHAYDENKDIPFLTQGIEGKVTLSSVYAVEEDKSGEKVEENKTIESINLYDAKIVNVKDLFPNSQKQEVIVFVNEDGDYVSDNGAIIAADVINDQSVQNVTTVSKKWIEDINKMLSEEIPSEDTEDVNEDAGEEVVEDTVEDEVVESSASTGVFPPTNGMSTEEFLANEAAESGEDTVEE